MKKFSVLLHGRNFLQKKFIAFATLSFIKSGKLAFLFKLWYYKYVCFRIKSRLEEPRLFLETLETLHNNEA